jgi:glycosyltransferase involved in cell wall biosynthesis
VNTPKSLQMVGSKALGGAERWFLRFGTALAERAVPAELAIRAGSQLDRGELPPLPAHRLPFLTVWDPISRGAVSRLIRKTSPDIVQTYMGRATRLAHLPLGRGPVHVARLGGYYQLHPYRQAHAWIGNTKGLCHWLINNGLPAERVFHIYNFVATPCPVSPDTLADLRAELGLRDDAWVLMAPGRFVPVKGHRYLLDAIARLPREIAGRPIHLLLLGEGPLEVHLREQALAVGIADRVVWAGWRTDPGPFYQLADLIVFPSLEEEALGNVILEAWSWSRPLVTSRFRGAREIARDQEDTWCVPCADGVGLARGIEEVLGDPELRSALAERGRRRVEAEFAPGPIIDRYLELYCLLAG